MPGCRLALGPGATQVIDLTRWQRITHEMARHRHPTREGRTSDARASSSGCVPGHHWQAPHFLRVRLRLALSSPLASGSTRVTQWSRLELNQRPLPYQGSDLTRLIYRTEHPRQGCGSRPGLEPGTSCMPCRCATSCAIGPRRTTTGASSIGPLILNLRLSASRPFWGATWRSSCGCRCSSGPRCTTRMLRSGQRRPSFKRDGGLPSRGATSVKPGLLRPRTCGWKDSNLQPPDP